MSPVAFVPSVVLYLVITVAFALVGEHSELSEDNAKTSSGELLVLEDLLLRYHRTCGADVDAVLSSCGQNLIPGSRTSCRA